jgi:hypothetical protein
MHLASRARGLIGGLLTALWLAGIVPAQEPPKVEYKVVTIRQLFSDTNPNTTLEAVFNRLGKQGWEAVAGGKAGVLFRKTKGDQAWEYRVVKSPDSTLNGKGTDDGVLAVLLEGLAVQGWQPCLSDLGNELEIIVQRPVPAAKTKTKTP